MAEDECRGILRSSDHIPLSFLSPRFQEMICTSSVNDGYNDKCLNEMKLLDWQHDLDDLIPGERPLDSTYFNECAKVIAPTLSAVCAELKSWTLEEFRKYYSLNLSWTQNEKLIEDCFVLSLKDGSSVLLSLLTLTAILERTLGNVYLLRGKQCPSMLKDLLVTKELSEIFTPLTMQFLRILIGPPISMNIRNVVWHGFLSPDEVHPQFCHILLALFAGLGHHLLQHHPAIIGLIPHRSPVQFSREEDLPFSSDLITQNISILNQLFCTSPFVPPSMRPVWKYALDLINDRRFGSAMVLILPQMEMSCRIVFTAVNQCPNRLLTAEATELFTTFDEMLQRHLPDGTRNKLAEYFGEGTMNFLHDMLTYPEGPRVRDRLSHGECDIVNFPAHLALKVVALSAAMSIKCLPGNSQLLSDKVLVEIRKGIDKYQSHYHPLQLIKKEILEVMTCLSKWKESPRPTADQLEYQKRWEALDDDDLDKTCLGVAGIICKEPSSAGILPDVCKPFSDLSVLEGEISALKISTLYRNQSSDHQSASSEEEVVGLCRRIMQHSLNVAHQVMQGLALKYQQWEEKSLRSRQRNTYIRMLDSIPDISCGLRSTLLFVVTIYASFPKGVAEVPINRKRIKILKQALQYVENLVTFTSLNKNRWEEAQKLTIQFYEKLSLCFK